MMRSRPSRLDPGPFRAADLPDGSRYELDAGHPIWCAPAGQRHAAASIDGALVIGTDPKVQRAGLDPGYSFAEDELAAPDIAVLPAGTPDGGWGTAAPPLLIEYHDRGSKKADLERRIRTFLERGTRYLWVVHLDGTKFVEVIEPGKPRVKKTIGQELVAPEVLENPVPVEALFEPHAARHAALRNLLRREGYDSLDAVRLQAERRGRREGRQRGLEAGHKKGREEGRAEGREQGIEQGREQGIERGRQEGLESGRSSGQAEALRYTIAEAAAARGWSLDPAQEGRLATADAATLRLWFAALVRASGPEVIPR